MKSNLNKQISEALLNLSEMRKYQKYVVEKIELEEKLLQEKNKQEKRNTAIFFLSAGIFSLMILTIKGFVGYLSIMGQMSILDSAINLILIFTGYFLLSSKLIEILVNKIFEEV